jgi:putative membrane protein
MPEARSWSWSTRLGRSVPPAPPLRADQQQKLAQLRNAGPSFDATYLNDQVQAHQQALALIQGYAQGGQDATLRQAAAETAATVRHHLDVATRLQQTTGR